MKKFLFLSFVAAFFAAIISNIMPSNEGALILGVIVFLVVLAAELFVFRSKFDRKKIRLGYGIHPNKPPMVRR